MARQRLLNENHLVLHLVRKEDGLTLAGLLKCKARTHILGKTGQTTFWAVNVNGIEVEMSHTTASAPAPEVLAYNQSSVYKREVLPLLSPQIRILEKRQLPLADEYQDTTISIRGSGLFDSGTTTILCPSQIATRINRLIGASDNGLHVNCSASTTGPIFHFTVGNGHAGNSFTIPLSPHQYILGDGNPTHGCMSAFQPGGPQDRWVLGLPFFVNRTLTFDIDNGRIGFSQLHNNASMFNNNGEVINEQGSGFGIASEDFGGYKDGPAPAKHNKF
ncbi:aspartic peptidase domain-containing protein [Kickxella alabastrina]|uniref:aspartic peptidase domain-containing protein n=1 Tax=Kickxella alabastrina TaxID=61397 RepID=UPI00221FC9C7|nr:aspartic peptidase domain-containing protein [Kickxella alabastrina]KAI7830962.1 aspartic peptidase domain-containing protein [Kickxella alabastrina]